MKLTLPLAGNCIALLVLSIASSATAQTPPTVASLTETASDGTVSLIVPSDPYPAWLTSKFPTPEERADVSISGPYSDPDGDGLVNLVERAMAFNPKVPEFGYPFPGIRPGGKLSLTTFRLRSAFDLDFLFEFSKDAKHWKVGPEFTHPFIVNNLGDYESWEEISQLTGADAPAQFMRLHVVRPSRTSFREALASRNVTPEQLVVEKCLIHTTPAGAFEGGMTMIPRVFPHSAFEIKWVFSNYGMLAFVETHEAMVEAYLDCYLSHLKPDFTISDYEIASDLKTILVEKRSDSDDSYAASFLALAVRFAEAHPSNSWFDAHVDILKNIANANLVTPRDSNGLVYVYQTGDPGRPRYLEDNVQVWSDLQLFAKLLLQRGDASASIYQSVCCSLRLAIHAHLWDEANSAWKWAYGYTEAHHARYYADLQCQFYPEFYGLTHPSGESETQRRYDGAWNWLVTWTAANNGGASWWKEGAWGPYIDAEGNTRTHVYSDMPLAMVATKRGELAQARSFMALSIKKWMPDVANPSGIMTIADLGHWKSLLKGAIPKP